MRRKQRCIIKQDYTENHVILQVVPQAVCTPNPCVQQAKPFAFTALYDFDAFLWLLRIIIVATFYLWNKAITPET